MLVVLHLHNETQNDTDFCCLTEGLKCCTVPLITRTRLDRVHMSVRKQRRHRDAKGTFTP